MRDLLKMSQGYCEKNMLYAMTGATDSEYKNKNIKSVCTYLLQCNTCYGKQHQRKKKSFVLKETM